MSTKQVYHNDSTPAERRAVIRNDQRVARNATTFSQFAHGDLGGRYAKEFPSSTVGSMPVPQYPRAASHQYDPVPPEPPIDFEQISAVEPCGTPAEIEKSLREASDGVGVPSTDAVVNAGGGGCRDAAATAHPRKRKSK